MTRTAEAVLLALAPPGMLTLARQGAETSNATDSGVGRVLSVPGGLFEVAAEPFLVTKGFRQAVPRGDDAVLTGNGAAVGWSVSGANTRGG